MKLTGEVTQQAVFGTEVQITVENIHATVEAEWRDARHSFMFSVLPKQAASWPIGTTVYIELSKKRSKRWK